MIVRVLQRVRVQHLRTVSNAASALVLLKGHKEAKSSDEDRGLPDLILSDLQMPEMSGEEIRHRPDDGIEFQTRRNGLHS